MHRVQGRLSTYHLIIKMSPDDYFLFRPMIFRSGIRYQLYRKKDRDKNRSF